MFVQCCIDHVTYLQIILQNFLFSYFSKVSGRSKSQRPRIIVYLKPGLQVDETVHNLDTQSFVEVRLIFSGACVVAVAMIF